MPEQTELVPPQVEQALAELAASISGEVESSTRVRAEYTSDASNYRVVPAGVVFPCDAEDVRKILAVCRRHHMPVVARGGGTSVAGNSISNGIVLDFSRHMHRILHIDPQARTATVEPGVVMSDLQAAAAPYGLRFGPDPSTQNRATFGGMVGNNACGPHAVAWGRTADNVLELRCIDGTGREFTAGAGEMPEPLADLVAANLSDIRTNLGRFPRQVSGYALEHLLPENGRDLAKMLVGSEGTLVTLLEIKLRLVPLAAAPMLVVLGYPDMPAAADAVPDILPYKPLAIEGMDRELVEVVRRARGEVPELPDGGGWLLVEVGAQEGEDPQEVPQRAEAIVKAAGTTAYSIQAAGAAAQRLWRIRADGAGLGGRTPAGSPAWPGWEDSAVPPEQLGNYLRALQKLLAKYELAGLMYGHFGDGCVHIRIDFPLHKAGGAKVFRDFLVAAADLALSFGGSLSGEHGDGRARSELLARMYPPKIIELFSQVKAIFDPQDLLNPGVLVRPRALDADLRRPVAPALAYAGGFHFLADDADFTNALHRCTGVGNCRADRMDAGFFMCPSYQATKEEKDVTRGRMRVLQEAANGQLVATFADAAVLESLDLCLGCKACSSDCPTGVDMARYKSETLYRAYKGKLRPITHYLLGNLPVLARLVVRVPGLARFANSCFRIAPLRKLAFSLSGIDQRRDMPGFAQRSFSAWARRSGQFSPQLPAELAADLPADTTATAAALRAGLSAALPAELSPDLPVDLPADLPAQEKRRYVVLWADSFSESLDTRGAQALAELLQRYGYTVLLPPASPCCGLTWITTGQLQTAKKKLQHLFGVLAPFAKNGIPIVGVEPSCTAVLRDDALDLLPEDKRASLIASMTFTLAELLTHPEFGVGEQLNLPDLQGMKIVAQPHCHHYSVMGWKKEAALLRKTGAELVQLSGCCGLAGNFGMEKGHYEISQAVAQNQLLPKLAAAGAEAVYLADGYSCRTQAAQLAGKQGVHLAELLLKGKEVRR